MRVHLRRCHCKSVIAILTFFILVLCYYLRNLPILDFNVLNKPAIDEDPPNTWSHHPVHLLHARANTQFQDLLQRQSKTPDDAEAEYIRRYSRSPPPGFRRWVEYALAQQSPIIDDFDVLTHSVHRFSILGATEVSRRMHKAIENEMGAFHNDGVENCTFTEGKFGQGCHHFADPLTALLGDAHQIAPDVNFLINFLDEPSVLIGPQEKTDSVSAWKNSGHHSIATAVTEACQLRGSATSNASTFKDVHTYGLPFVQDINIARDLCQRPEYESEHGFVMSPPSFRRMQTDIPLLSQAAPSPFSDILYPSTHYGLKSSLYKQSQDVTWRWKKNAVYWTGSATGGYWSKKNWRHGHRQRLATLAMHRGQRHFTYLRSTGATYPDLEAYTSRAFESSLFDIILTKIVGCDNDATCDEQNQFFNTPRSHHPDWRPFRYRFVLDIDGNSYSGRFYRFLASHSVPLKVSIFQEWHDERLVPWLHYVPVSLGMEELPEMMRFLATTAEGQRISQRIAEAGRHWYFRAMTPTHQGVYLYRLMLELAWLQDILRPVG